MARSNWIPVIYRGHYYPNVKNAALAARLPYRRALQLVHYGLCGDDVADIIREKPEYIKPLGKMFPSKCGIPYKVTSIRRYKDPLHPTGRGSYLYTIRFDDGAERFAVPIHAIRENIVAHPVLKTNRWIDYAGCKVKYIGEMNGRTFYRARAEEDDRVIDIRTLYS